MRVLFVLFGMLLSIGISSADPPATAWSPAVTGLRGHLSIEPTHDPDPTEPTYRVMLVLENVGVIGNLGKISASFALEFDTFNLKLEVKDKQGVPPPNILGAMAGNRMSETLRLELPPEGVLSFPIARGGDSPPRYASDKLKGKFLQKDNDFACWVVPPASVGKYFISGTLDEVRPLNATLAERRRETPNAWHGTLLLPPVELPQD